MKAISSHQTLGSKANKRASQNVKLCFSSIWNLLNPSIISHLICILFFYCDLSKQDFDTHYLIECVVERSTLTYFTASVNYQVDWTKILADYRELSYLFTGCWLVCCSFHHYSTLWQLALQSQSEETNPQRLVTPTLMKAMPKKFNLANFKAH